MQLISQKFLLMFKIKKGALRPLNLFDLKIYDIVMLNVSEASLCAIEITVNHHIVLTERFFA